MSGGGSGYSKMDDHGRPVKPVPRRVESSDKAAKISKTLDDVTSQMKTNIGKATKRGADLKDLEDQTAILEASGNSFLKTSGDVKKMFQWKAFLWQLAFASIILVILALVTLYILNATGVLNHDDDGSTVIVAAPTAAPAALEENSADSSSSSSSSSASDTTLFTLNPGFKAFQQQPENSVLSGVGEACSVGISTITKNCAQGLSCVTAKEGATEGTCQKPSDDKNEGSGGCKKGTVKCTRALRDSGRNCIIGRCVISGAVSETVPSQPEKAPAATTSTTTTQGTKPAASAPLTGSSLVYKTNGETAGQVESEIREALVTLHQHGADCAVGILHKDCTLELLMQGWGVAT